MITAATNAERIRFVGIRGWVPAALVLALAGVVLPLRHALAVATDPALPPASDSSAMVPLTGVGVLGLAVAAAWSVSREYSTGTHDVARLLQPSGWRWLLAPMTVHALVSSVAAALAALLSVVVVALVTPDDRQEGLGTMSAAPMVARAAVVAVFVVVLAVAVASVLRRTGRTMAVVLGWPLVLEPLLSGVPAARPLLLGSAVPTAICGPSGVPDGSWGSISAAMAWLGLLAVGAFGVAATVSRR